MVFKEIQAKLISEFTIITSVLEKQIISKGGGALKIETGKFENLAKPSRGISKYSKIGGLNAGGKKKNKIRFFDQK